MKRFNILKDKLKNERLMRDGFVRIELLDHFEIKQLKDYYLTQHFEETINGLFVSANRFEAHKAKEISSFISNILKNRLSNLVDEVEILGGTFIVKSANYLERLEAHQDWNIVDENNGRSYTLWIPLEKTNDFNGALYMLQGSHDRFRGYRHVTIPSIFGKVYDKVWKYMVPVYLNAGEGVLFDHAVGHASMPNLTPKDRIAVTCSVISKGAKFRFYCLEENVISEYKGQADYYQKEEAKFGPSNLEKIEVKNVKPYQLTNFQLLLYYGFFNRIWNLNMLRKNK